MSHALTETAANADFATGISMPDNGIDSFQDAVDIWETAMQEHSDRLQALAKLAGLITGTQRKVYVPIAKELNNASTRFTYVFSSGAPYWQQSDVGSVGGLTFEVPTLPIGAKITGAYAWWANNNNTTLPVGTMPTLTLKKIVFSAGAAADPGSLDATVASQADTTAVVATYKLQHKIEITGLSEVVTEDTSYQLLFAGEDGANEQTGGNLGGLWVVLGV